MVKEKLVMTFVKGGEADLFRTIVVGISITTIEVSSGGERLGLVPKRGRARSSMGVSGWEITKRKYRGYRDILAKAT